MIHRARDFLCSSLGESITLSDMAHVACLSPNHFIRTFKQIVGQTPHQHLTSVRLQRAASQLVRTDMLVLQIALSVGFESASSFSCLFRRRFGLSPAQYRVVKW